MIPIQVYDALKLYAKAETIVSLKDDSEESKGAQGIKLPGDYLSSKAALLATARNMSSSLSRLTREYAERRDSGIFFHPSMGNSIRVASRIIRLSDRR